MVLILVLKTDIDMCALIDEDKVDGVFEKIQKRFDIDSIHENRNCGSERQLVFHVANSEKYHMVDFNAYLHGLAGTTFVKNDDIDACKVIFDRYGAIQYKEYDANAGANERAYWEMESEYRFSQLSRVEKLNRILRVSSVDDIMENLHFAEEWYHALINEKQREKETSYEILYR